MLLLLTGASGVGKSTCRIAIEAALGDELDCVELRDVDVLLAGDPVAPGELIAAPSADRLDRIAVCLLDCDAASQTERLRRRGEPEELLPRHVAFADWMREHVRDPGHMPEVIMDNGWDAMRWERLVGADWSFDVIDTSGRARRGRRGGRARVGPGRPELSVTVLGYDVPVMQAPVGRGAAAALAIAVSQAGGLGTLGASWTEPATLREQIRSIGRATDRPFCVNLVLDFEQDERLEVAAEERVPWVSFSFGMRREMIARAHAGGMRALVQVASADAARAAAEAGADALIVQGVEAGGHVQSVVGLLPLLAEVGRAVSLPLLAAGGIADPVSARGALAAGATTVVMGTRFVASDECDAHPDYKARLLRAEGRDTVLTQLFDVGWDAPHRVLRNSTYERWEAAGRPDPGRRPGEGEELAPGVVRYAVNLPLAGSEGDVEGMAMYAGQGVGAIGAVESAAEIVERFAATLRAS